MNSINNYLRLALSVLLLLVLLVCININNSNATGGMRQNIKSICVGSDDTIKAKRKKCLLRPDTGPCRADILSYYYDAKKHKCYRFFYGGCQGNGNNFKSRRECIQQCFISSSMATFHIPYFCNLAFDFGHCFGHYNRWSWDPISKVCKQRIYSGCGGNQNNFETKSECMATCLLKPNNTLSAPHQHLTTCIPFTLPEFN